VSHGTLPSHALHGVSSHHASHEHEHEHDDADSFQALLNDPALTPHHDHHHRDHHQDHDQDAVDRDMAMLIDHHDSSSPSPDPCASSTSSLRCEMEIDDLDLGTASSAHKGDTDDGREKDAGGSGGGGGDRIDATISPDGELGPAFGTAGGKRSSIYDVVFDAPG
jgi:hypothetical protein